MDRRDRDRRRKELEEGRVRRDYLVQHFGQALGEAAFNYVNPEQGATWEDVFRDRRAFAEALVSAFETGDFAQKVTVIEAMLDVVDRKIDRHVDASARSADPRM